MNDDASMPGHVQSQVDQGVGPLAEDTSVRLTLTGRPQTLTMPWNRARDMFVRRFGIDAIQDCRRALERGHRWTGTSAGHPGMALTVDLDAQLEDTRNAPSKE